MSKFASFIPSAVDQVVPVIGWYRVRDADIDPDGSVYPSLPANILAMTTAQLIAAGLVSVPQDFWADVQGRVGGIYSVDQAAAKLVLTPLLMADAQAQAVQRMTVAAAAQIALGFPSSALGAAYTYPLDLTSQSNLQAAVIRAQMPPPPASITYMCADSTGAWARRAHTPAQITQAALDGMAYVEAVLAKKDGMVEVINAATTVAAAQAVAWSFP
jgi:hypothetical protein